MTWDPVWEEVFKKQDWGKYPSEEIIRFVARNFYTVNKRSETRILEVGCGPGANLWYLAREGFATYGIDGSTTAIKKASDRLDEEFQLWIGELVVGDIENLPFEEGFFDAVIDNEAVYCNSFEKSIKIYSDIARVLKRGGKLFSRALSTGCWGDRTGTKVGYNAWIVNEGPALGKGYARFTDLEDIGVLMPEFQIEELQLITRRIDNLQHEVKEWVIMAEKS